MALWGKRERVQCNAEQVFSCMHMLLVKFFNVPCQCSRPACSRWKRTPRDNFLSCSRKATGMTGASSKRVCQKVRVDV